MPYKRGYKTQKKRTFRKKVYKTPTWKKLANAYSPTLSSGISLAKKVAMLAMKVNSELKYYDVATNFSQSNTASLRCLTNVDEGDTQVTRNGISQLNNSLDFHVDIVNNSNATSTFFRYIIFVWNENVQETPPTAAKILENTSYFMSPLNIECSKQFSVIVDKIFTLNSVNNVNKNIRKFIKLNPLHSKYNSTTAGSQTTGHVYLLMVSDQAVNTPSLTLYTRLRFYDN